LWEQFTITRVKRKIETAVHRCAECFENFALLCDVDALEGLDVRRVNGKELGKLIEPLRKAVVQRSEPPQVLANLGDPGIRLAQQTMRDHVRDVLAGDTHLSEAVTHAPQLLGDECEPGAIEECFL
jgi:hypothetical protein